MNMIVNTCPICLEECDYMISLTCSHSFCNECMNTWRQVSTSCPVCRQNIVYTPSSINAFGVELTDIPTNIGHSYPSEKGISAPVNEDELDVLGQILNSTSFDSVCNNTFITNNYTNYKVMIQDYLSNGWWIGIVVRKSRNIVKLMNLIRVQRQDGRMYRCSPDVRDIPIHENAQIYTFY